MNEQTHQQFGFFSGLKPLKKAATTRMNRSNLLGTLLAIGTALFTAPAARANFHVWTGAVNGYWSNTNNWSGGSAPQVFETPPVEIDFPSGTGRLQTTNDIGFVVLGGVYGLQVDSIIVADNYTFSGVGYGTNIWFSGNPAPFFGINLQNFYIPTPNITVTFDNSLYLYFQSTNTITNAANSTLDIQSTMTGSGAWTFQGSGELRFDGDFDYYNYNNNLTGTCTVQGGDVVLNRWDNYDGLATSAINGPLIIGTTNTANPAVLFEYNPNGNLLGEIGGGWGSPWATFPVTILPSGVLANYGVTEGGISSLTMTGGVVVLGSESFTYCPPDPWDPCYPVSIYGYISATNITTYAPPSGVPSVIESNEQGGGGTDNNGNPILPDFEGVFIYPYTQSGTNTPAIINVVSGTLNISATLFGPYNPTNVPLFIKTGSGTLGLYGTNAFYANSVIQQGVVALGGDTPFGPGIAGDWYNLPTNSVVESNGTEIVVSGPFSCPVPLVLNGYGTNGTDGAILVQNDGASFASVTLGSDSAVQVANPSATLTFGIYGDHYLVSTWGWYSYSPLDGTANLHKIGPGTLQLDGHYQTNAMSGTTYVDQGTLVLLGVTNYVTSNLTLLNGPLVVGTNGGVAYATAELESSEPIMSTAPVTVNAGSELAIIGTNRQTLSSLTLNGSTVAGGTLILNGDPTVQNLASYAPAIFSTLSLHGTNRTLNVPQFSTLSLGGNIIDGGNGAGVVKAGPGDLNLYGTNNCAGPTLVTAGRVGTITSGAFAPTGEGVVVSNGAELLLYDGVSIGGAPLWLTGTGTDGYGALKSFGTNSWAGTLTLVSNATVDVITNSYWHSSQLELSGVITGAGQITKTGWGNLLLDGSQSNNYAGGTLLQQGLMTLSKTNGGAIPGALTIGLGVDGTSGDIVRTSLGYQLSPGNPVNISSSGLLDVSGNFSYVTTVGSLTGSGNIQLGGNGLDCGYDNTATTYGGAINGIGSGYLLKYGTGAFTLSGSSSFPGILQCEAGELYVNGSMPSAIVSFATGGLLGGAGTVGPFSFTHGTLAPGYNGPGILNSGSVWLNTNDTFLAAINGTTAGSGYSQLNVTGTVSLGNAKLQLNMPVAGLTNSQLTLINNDGVDAVTGTFSGLPEGSTITAANGAMFKISYHGGSGNDVVLTQLSLPTPSAFTGIIKLGGGNIQLNGTGNTNTAYTVWANTNLVTTNWITIGTATASGVGQIQFTDTNAPLYKQRFYRFSLP